MSDEIDRSLQLCEFSPEAAGELKRRYGEPSRSYHNLEHVSHVLSVAEQLISFYRFPSDRAMQLRHAVWFHDAVYEPTAQDNEERSAELYLDLVTSRSARWREVVHDAIVDTKEHTAPSSFVSACLLDADLAGLAAPREVYETNSAKVRSEYSMFDDDLWRAGRSAVIESLLQLNAIFHTSYGVRFESDARENLTRELAALGRG